MEDAEPLQQRLSSLKIQQEILLDMWYPSVIREAAQHEPLHGERLPDHNSGDAAGVLPALARGTLANIPEVSGCILADPAFAALDPSRVGSDEA